MAHAQQWGYMFGEYENTNGLVSNSHDTDVPCACAVYMLHSYTRKLMFSYMIPAIVSIIAQVDGPENTLATCN